MHALTTQMPQRVQGLLLFLQALFNLAATTTLIIWNTFLTLDDEVEFIWSSHSTFVKGVYFMARYLPLLLFCGTTLSFFGNTNADLCPRVMWFVNISGSIVTACSNILLIQRVYAFYGRSKYILWTLCSGFILSETLVLANLILYLPGIRVTKDNFPSPIPELFGRCIIEKFPPIAAYAWFCKLAFEAFAFVCIVARFAKLQLTAWKTGIPSPRLYNVFLRDGTWAFFVLFLLLLFTAILIRAQNVIYLSLILWSLALSSICSTRLVLNLHAAKKTQYSVSARSFAGYPASTSITLNCDQVAQCR